MCICRDTLGLELLQTQEGREGVFNRIRRIRPFHLVLRCRLGRFGDEVVAQVEVQVEVEAGEGEG